MKPICFLLMVAYVYAGFASSQEHLRLAWSIFWPCMLISVLMSKWQKKLFITSTEFLIMNVVFSILVGIFAGNMHSAKQRQLKHQCAQNLKELGERYEESKPTENSSLSRTCPKSHKPYSLVITETEEGQGFEIRCLGSPHEIYYRKEPRANYPRYISGFGIAD